MERQDSGGRPQQEDSHAQQSYGQQPDGQSGPMEKPKGVKVLAALYFIQAAVLLITILYILNTVNSLIEGTGLGGTSLFMDMKCLVPMLIFVLIPVMIGVGLYKGIETVRGIALGFAILRGRQ